MRAFFACMVGLQLAACAPVTHYHTYAQTSPHASQPVRTAYATPVSVAPATPAVMRAPLAEITRPQLQPAPDVCATGECVQAPAYHITKDSWCGSSCDSYPVSHKARQTGCTQNKVEYGSTSAMPSCNNP